MGCDGSSRGNRKPPHPLLRVGVALALGLTLLTANSAEVDAQPIRGGCSGELEFGLVEQQRLQVDLMRSRGMTASASGALPAELLDTLRSYLRRLEAAQAGSAALVYALSGDKLCAWLLTPDGRVSSASSSEASTLDRVAKAADDVRAALRTRSAQASRLPSKRGAQRMPGNAPAATVGLDTALAALARALFPSAIWAAMAQVRHLVILPVRDLGTQPFAALRLAPTEPALADRMSITIAPAIADIAVGPTLRWRGIEPGPRQLVVGNPDASSDPDWHFPSLPGAEREALAVARQTGASAPLLGTHATLEAVRAGMVRASYLHFATHGVADESDPLEGSFLALTNGRLTAKEIQATRLDAWLAVLSACQTGLGRAHDGGVIGLARAFRLAGVPGVVMSLWNVDDDATAALMREFTVALANRAPHEALRVAMLAARQTFPGPAQWASFVYFGEPMVGPR